jgi:plastocyanin
LARALAFLAVLLAGCAAPDAAPPPVRALPAGIDWSRAETLTVVLDEFSFAPAMPLLHTGRPYRLRFENRGGGGHNFSAPEFFRAAALRPGPTADEAHAAGAVEVARGETEELALVPLEAGSFPLVCTHLLHGAFGMTGTIRVE